MEHVAVPSATQGKLFHLEDRLPGSHVAAALQEHKGRAIPLVTTAQSSRSSTQLNELPGMFSQEPRQRPGWG